MLTSSVKLQVFPNMLGIDHPAHSPCTFLLKPTVKTSGCWTYIYPDSWPRMFKWAGMLQFLFITAHHAVSSSQQVLLLSPDLGCCNSLTV